jgi:hypothetical protein
LKIESGKLKMSYAVLKFCEDTKFFFGMQIFRDVFCVAKIAAGVPAFDLKIQEFRNWLR